jgi:cyclophilin family peptidyl-prolyl cis-trans isomerase
VGTDKRQRQKSARREKLEAQRRADQRRQLIRRIALVVIVAVVIVGSVIAFSGSSSNTPTSTSTSSTTTTTTKPVATTTTIAGATTTIATASRTQAQVNALAVAAGCPQSPYTRVNNDAWSSAPAMAINTSTTYYATFNTTAGTFVVALNPKIAPQTVNNFVFLAQHGYYNCIIFHRVIPGFMIQGGDPTGTGTGGPGYTIADEFPAKGNPTYPLYSIAMANTGAAHSGGSQFFIVTGTSGETLSNSYTLFGQTISGTNAIDIISADGDANASTDQTGTSLKIIQRILTVTISTKG